METRVQILEHMVNNQQGIIERYELQHQQQQDLIIEMDHKIQDLVFKSIQTTSELDILTENYFGIGPVFQQQQPTVSSNSKII